MLAAVLLAASLLCASALATLPEHLSHVSVGKSLGPVDVGTLHAPPPQYLTVPLDHFATKGGPTWRLKFFVDATEFAPGGIMLVTMPSEGATHGCGAGQLAKALRAVAICSQHRYFGDSVPFNDSSTSAFAKYLSV